ncbi:MAG: radical SAM protein [Candidatus Woesearchaeota archaeon]
MKNDQGVILYIGQICNNDCIMCSVHGNNEHKTDYSILKNKLIRRREETDCLSFTGGEPTEHPDIIKLFKEANRLNYKNIIISTNGRNFADKKFADKLANLGLKHANIAIHGPKEIHNEIIQKKGYEEALQGLKNLLNNGVKIRLDSVLLKRNIDHLKKIWEDVYGLGVREIGVIDLIPEGGHVDFSELMVSYTEKKDFFYKHLSYLRKIKMFYTVNFTRCILPVQLPNNFLNTTTYQKENDWTFDGLNNKGRSALKKKINICKKCPYKKNCFGFRKDNLKEFGEKNIKKMLKSDDFIRKSKKILT